MSVAVHFQGVSFSAVRCSERGSGRTWEPLGTGNAEREAPERKTDVEAAQLQRSPCPFSVTPSPSPHPLPGMLTLGACVTALGQQPRKITLR